MVHTLGRVIAGLILASLTAGLIQALFLPSTYALVNAPDNTFTGSQVLERIGLIATHSAIFASAFALIAVVIGEWMDIRSLPYYLLAGAAIALLGFAAQYSSEVPGQPTFFNNTALKALLTTGFFSGLVYWMVAGRGSAAVLAGAPDAETIGVPPPKTWKNRPKIIVEDKPKVTADAKPKRSSLSERLADELKKDEAAKAEPVKPEPAKAEPAGAATKADAAKAEVGIDAKPAAAAKGAEKSDVVAKPVATPGVTSVPSTKPAAAPTPPPAPTNDGEPGKS